MPEFVHDVLVFVPLLVSTANNEPSKANAFVGVVWNPLLSPASEVIGACNVGVKNPVFTIGAAIVMLKLLVAVAAMESVTRTVKVETAAMVGVPVMAPVLAFRVRPAGSEPVTTDHVRGAVPPLAASVAE